jgi:hypothetical protein
LIINHFLFDGYLTGKIKIMWIDEIKEGKTYWYSCGSWQCKILVLKHYGQRIECIIPTELDENGQRKSCDMGMRKGLNEIECERYVQFEIQKSNG